MAKSGGEAGLFDLAGRGVYWWLDELRAMLPAALKARARGRAAAIDCFVLPDGRVAAGLRRAGGPPDKTEALEAGPALTERLRVLAPAARQGTVRLSVPRGMCLLRRSQLPLRALSHAGAILRHEAEALLPLPPADILADWYVETEDAGTREIHLVQAVLARPRIWRVEEAIAAAGLKVTSITVGDDEGRPIPVDLLAAREPSFRAALLALPLSAKLMLAGALVLLASAPVVANARYEAALAEIAEARAAAPKPGATALSAGAVADFLDAQTRRVPAAAILDEIARRLPRDATLSHINLDGDRLTLGLEGPGAASAAGAFEASPFLEPGKTGADGTLALRVRPLGDGGLAGEKGP